MEVVEESFDIKEITRMAWDGEKCRYGESRFKYLELKNGRRPCLSEKEYGSVHGLGCDILSVCSLEGPTLLYMICMGLRLSRWYYLSGTLDSVNSTLLTYLGVLYLPIIL